MPTRLSPSLAAALLAALALGAAHCSLAAQCRQACGDEPEPYLDAAALVPPSLLSGPGFRVVPEVRIRGYMANFLIDTKWGPLRAASIEMLGVRVAEMPAIETLERASRSAAFAHALGERGRSTGAAVVNVIAHPVDTIVGLPRGVVRFVRTQIDRWGDRARSLADRTARHAENDGDPFRAPSGPMTAGRDLPPDDPEASQAKRSRAWYARAGREAARETRRYLKFSHERRDMARVLGVDPNSTNPILDDRLDTLAWAAVGGNFSAGAALGTVTGTAAAVISNSGKLNQYVLQQDPEQLRDRLQARLRALCSDDVSIRSFLRRGGFSDTLRVALVDALERLHPAAGNCDQLIELAATTHGEIEARFLVDALQLLVRRVPDPRGGRLLVLGAALAWRDADGSVVLPLPVDYLSWSHAIGEFLDQHAFAVRNKTVLITGNASMRAQRGLTERGWSLVLDAPPDADGPAYAFTTIPRQRR